MILFYDSTSVNQLGAGCSVTKNSTVQVTGLGNENVRILPDRANPSKGCGASMHLPENGNTVDCPYCKRTHRVEDIFEKVKQLIG